MSVGEIVSFYDQGTGEEAVKILFFEKIKANLFPASLNHSGPRRGTEVGPETKLAKPASRACGEKGRDGGLPPTSLFLF